MARWFAQTGPNAPTTSVDWSDAPLIMRRRYRAAQKLVTMGEWFDELPVTEAAN